ncbi:MAG: hypothetical protein ACO3FU_06085, partial [Burkholderiaceae bacterium]
IHPSSIPPAVMIMGWIAGAMVVTDPAVLPYVPTQPGAGTLPVVDITWRYTAGALGAALVWLLGMVVKRRMKQKNDREENHA